MYPFWDSVINPLVMASKAQRLVEIGALRGETTVKMLEDLGADAEVHVIDPLPQFDPTEHVERFGGRYVFHRDLSLNVLGDLPAFDVALIDGDHNWYTVYNEMRLLREGARRDDRPLPLCILHDVGWPYGRRDLYYDPSNIPAEHRQPYAYKGMMPGRPKLLNRGGMNITLANAVEEGGARNGVRTGLDDFVAEHDHPLREVIIPIYFGLAIVAEERWLDTRPEVAEILDHIESASGTAELLELSESIRLDGVVFEHNIERMRNDRLDRAITRHLDLLQASLLDEHYVENEERIDYLLSCIASGAAPDPAIVRNPGQARAAKLRDRDHDKAAGTPASKRHLAYTSMGRHRLRQLGAAIDLVLDDGVAGDIVDIGCGRGGGAIYARGVLDAREVEDRRVVLIDDFHADPRTGAGNLLDGGLRDLRSDLNQVRSGFDRYGLLDDRVVFLQGRPTETVHDDQLGAIALARLGRTLGDELVATLEAVYPKIVEGGVVIIEHTGGAAEALDAFRAAHAVEEHDRVGDAGIAWRKVEPASPASGASASLARTWAPLAPAAPDGVDLSVVVVFHNMRREAERTLHSLSRHYQHSIDDLTYEVIAIDNGSAPDQALDTAFVESFGPEFRLVRLGDEAPPSPTAALNLGIRESTGRAVALMIDGAHVLTPGVFHYAMAGLTADPSTIVATQQWYVGPGQQPEAVAEGYDQAAEDALFAGIEWPHDGYRLFEISHFIGERDWFDGILESNCLIVPRPLLEQVGGFDDNFDMPGGGYANLELWERLGNHPDAAITSILGEGSFHQVHGGTTTNEGERADRRASTFSYAEHYQDLRGRPMKGPAKRIDYVGSFRKSEARRTRSRRLTSLTFRPPDAGRELPTTPAPIPDELTTSFIEASWHNLAWRETTWRGVRVEAHPADLHTYQELVHELRPDHVIVATDEPSGLPAFFAALLGDLDHGAVVHVGPHLEDAPPTGRIHTVHADLAEPIVGRKVGEIVGDTANALVVFSRFGPPRPTVQGFRHLADFVPVGGYVVVERTLVNGHPVWPDHGPGPLDAVRRILTSRGDFMADTEVERYGLTFNSGGYLRKVR